MTIREELVQWMESRVGDGYIYGAQGHNLTEILQHYAKAKLNTNATNIGQWVESAGLADLRFWDCSGIIAYFLLDRKIITADITANGLYTLCEKQVTEPKAGDLCFLVKNHVASHVGVYTGKSVIHALGTAKGVVEEDISKRTWECYDFPFEKTQTYELKKGDKILLTTEVDGYTSADKAKKGDNPAVRLRMAIYHVYKVSSGCVNITRIKDTPGSWVVKEELEKVIERM